MARWCVSWASLAAAAWASAPAAAGAAPSGKASTQYYFLLDDSGSMATAPPLNDTERLSALATKAILTGLDDEDQVEVVALNLDNTGPTQIRRLGPVRDELVARVEKIADLDKGATMCAPAIARAAKTLEENRAEGIEQVFVFLTDGACEDGGVGGKDKGSAVDLAVDAFLKKHAAAIARGQLRFHLLGLNLEEPTPALKRLAEATNGSFVPIRKGSGLAGIPAAFGQALAPLSDGPPLSSKGSREIAPYRAAVRVKVLAVALDDGKPLTLSLSAKGQAPKLENVHQGEYQYTGRSQPPAGKPRPSKYRYVIADYHPTGDAVTVDVTGSGKGWEAVALPEFDVVPRMTVTSGKCAAQGKVVESGTTGMDYCFRVDLQHRDGKGAAVGVDDLGKGLQLDLRAADGFKGLTRAGTLEVPAMRDGETRLTPVLRSTRGEPRVMLAGITTSFIVGSQRINPTPSMYDVPELVPGAEAILDQLSFDGTFSPREARIGVERRSGRSACVTFSVGGKKEGETVQLAPGQKFPVVASAAPFCGAESFSEAQNVTLKFELAGEPPLPSVAIPAKVQMNVQVRVPKEISVKVDAGASVLTPFEITGNGKAPIVFTGVLRPPQPGGSWPAEGLDLGFEHDGKILAGPDGKPAMTGPLTVGAGGGLRVVADVCCAKGVNRGEVTLTIPNTRVEPLRVPVVVEVQPASAWACHGRQVLKALAGLSGSLFVFYLIWLYNRTYFIDAKKLAARFDVHSFDAKKSARLDSEGTSTFRRKLVLRKPGFGARLVNWLASAPWGGFQETWRIDLPDDVDNISPLPVKGRDSFEKRATTGASAEGIFATARISGVAVWAAFASPEKGAKNTTKRPVGQVIVEHSVTYKDKQPDMTLVDLSNKFLAIDVKIRRAEQVAGYKVGSLHTGAAGVARAARQGRESAEPRVRAPLSRESTSADTAHQRVEP